MSKFEMITYKYQLIVDHQNTKMFKPDKVGIFVFSKHRPYFKEYRP